MEAELPFIFGMIAFGVALIIQYSALLDASEEVEALKVEVRHLKREAAKEYNDE